MIQCKARDNWELLVGLLVYESMKFSLGDSAKIRSPVCMQLDVAPTLVTTSILVAAVEEITQRRHRHGNRIGCLCVYYGIKVCEHII